MSSNKTTISTNPLDEAMLKAGLIPQHSQAQNILRGLFELADLHSTSGIVIVMNEFQRYALESQDYQDTSVDHRLHLMWTMQSVQEILVQMLENFNPKNPHPIMPDNMN